MGESGCRKSYLGFERGAWRKDVGSVTVRSLGARCLGGGGGGGVWVCLCERE